MDFSLGYNKWKHSLQSSLLPAPTLCKSITQISKLRRQPWLKSQKLCPEPRKKFKRPLLLTALLRIKLLTKRKLKRRHQEAQASNNNSNSNSNRFALDLLTTAIVNWLIEPSVLVRQESTMLAHMLTLLLTTQSYLTNSTLLMLCHAVTKHPAQTRTTVVRMLEPTPSRLKVKSQWAKSTIRPKTTSVKAARRQTVALTRSKRSSLSTTFHARSMCLASVLTKGADLSKYLIKLFN